MKYRVKKGDTLGHIAEYYKTTALNIRKWNGMRYGKPIFASEVLKIYVPNYLNMREPSFSVADPRLFLIHYRVRSGDSINSLANKFGVEKDELKLWNSLKNDLLKKDQLLEVWTMKVTEVDNIAGNEKVSIHTVRRGDTLWDISNKNGVSISQMLAWNPWAEKSPIKPGDRLKIYRK